MDTVGTILKQKGHEVHHMGPKASVKDAVEKMCAVHIGAVLVVEAERPVGIFTERDLMTRVILEHKEPASTLVEEVMTADVVCVPVETRLGEAMAIMTEQRCRHLPVVDEGRVVGIVSIGDLVRQQSRNQKFEIRMLTNYICGTYPG
jgi:CBS domain-containing protein